jgi:hypothetical protein
MNASTITRVAVLGDRPIELLDLRQVDSTGTVQAPIVLDVEWIESVDTQVFIREAA